jgi:hypothetical protein
MPNFNANGTGTCLLKLMMNVAAYTQNVFHTQQVTEIEDAVWIKHLIPQKEFAVLTEIYHKVEIVNYLFT